MVKLIKENNIDNFEFPGLKEAETIELISKNNSDEFIIDINRKIHQLKKDKCTFQNRYRNDIILLRLDITNWGTY